MTLLADVYPPGSFLAPRLEESSARWAPNETHTIEAMTGNLITMAGSYPMLVHRSVATREGLALLADCGLPTPTALDMYSTRDQYAARVALRVEAGEIAAHTYPPPSGARGALVAGDLLGRLNNKANLPDMADDRYLASRSLIDGSDADALRRLRAPVVLKVATVDPNAGGVDVYVCRSQRHVTRALSFLEGAPQFLAEELIEAKRNWCIQFIVGPHGRALYLGVSQQMCMANGVHGGNLIEPGVEPFEESVAAARQVVERAAAQGFVGLCGIDVLETADGSPFIIDPNFRPVSSTAFLVHYIRDNARCAGKVARLAFCQFAGPLSEMIGAARVGLASNWLVPLATFDPIAGGLSHGPARLRVMILADDIRQLAERERLLQRRGLTFLAMREAAIPSAQPLLLRLLGIRA